MHSKLHLHENCRTTNTCGRLCATQIMCDTGCVCTTQIMCGRLIMYDRLCATQIMTSSWTDSPRILTSLTRSACCFVILVPCQNQVWSTRQWPANIVMGDPPHENGFIHGSFFEILQIRGQVPRQAPVLTNDPIAGLGDY